MIVFLLKHTNGVEHRVSRIFAHLKLTEAMKPFM